jgi:Transposase DDE domain group 1
VELRAETVGAIKWTRLSCRTFAANAVRLQLHALAYNLGNFLGTLATPELIKDWSLTSLKEKLIKIGARSSATAALSPSRWPRSPSHGKCSKRFCGSSRNCGRSRHQRQRETSDGHAFKSNPRQECVRMPGKMARSDSRTLFGTPEMPATGPTSGLGFRPAQKRLPFTLIRSSSGEYRLNPLHSGCSNRGIVLPDRAKI